MTGCIEIFEERLRVASLSIQDAPIACLQRSLGDVFSGTQLAWNGGVAASRTMISAGTVGTVPGGNELAHIAHLRGILLEDNLNHLSITSCSLEKVMMVYV